MPNRKYLVFRISSSMLMVKPRQFSLKNLEMWGNYFVRTNKQNKDVSPTDNAWEWDFKNLICSYPSGTGSWCGLHVHKKAVAYFWGHSGEDVTDVTSFPPHVSVQIPCMQIPICMIRKKCWNSTTFTARWDLNAVSIHCDQIVTKTTHFGLLQCL